MEQVQIVNYHALRCLQAVPKPGEAYPRGSFILVTTAEGQWLLAERIFHRAGSITTPRILQAAPVVLSCYSVDQATLSQSGFDATWQKNFSADVTHLQKDYTTNQQQEATAHV